MDSAENEKLTFPRLVRGIYSGIQLLPTLIIQLELIGFSIGMAIIGHFQGKVSPLWFGVEAYGLGVFGVIAIGAMIWLYIPKEMVA